ncbi:hypothetical protein, partial [Virgibacillus salexigens]|uniref:hypothetical protein n=1 Tax=Virgibacillus massiliensis TaxID=1462526 RepID=UPI001E6193BD
VVYFFHYLYHRIDDACGWYSQKRGSRKPLIRGQYFNIIILNTDQGCSEEALSSWGIFSTD